MKSKRIPRKSKFEGVQVTASEGAKINVTFDEVNGITTVDYGDRIETKPLMFSVYYDNKNKSRILVSLPYNLKEYLDDIIKAFSDYDIVCSVDTSMGYNGMYFTVGVLTVLYKITKHDNHVSLGLTHICIISQFKE